MSPHKPQQKSPLLLPRPGKKAFFLKMAITCAIIILSASFLSFIISSSSPEEISLLNQLIQQEGLHWQAGETNLTRLPPSERKKWLGGFIPSFEQPPRLAPVRVRASLPVRWDWRNVEGRNYLTSVKSQGGCGSCWAFAALGMVEAVYNIDYNRFTINQEKGSPPSRSGLPAIKRPPAFPPEFTPGFIIQALNYPDLSEQELISCSPAGNCDGGQAWKALDYILNFGIGPEHCFFYQASDTACNLCAHHAQTLTRIKGWGWVTLGSVDENRIKSALLEGPLVLYMAVYSDFYAYRGGIYEPTSAATYEGGHLVVLVGYDDHQNCWMAKNSWGHDWGEQGYFKIRRGVCRTGKWVLQAWGATRDNEPPVLYPLDSVSIKEGETLTVQLRAYDPDDDELFFGIEDPPPGADFNTRQGLLTWKTNHTHAGVYRPRFFVTDGLETRYTQLTIKLINVKITKGKY